MKALGRLLSAIVSDADILGGWYPPASPPPPRRGVFGAVLLGFLAVVCLVALVGSGVMIYRELTRPPTRNERATAATAEVGQRWEEWSAGRIFPGSLPYNLDLGGRETAALVGIDPGQSCTAALDTATLKIAQQYGCRAVLRATYLGQTQGVVATVGVIVLPDAAAAQAVHKTLPSDKAVTLGLHALGFPNSVAATFNDSARQVATNDQKGPYVGIAVAGYSDGRPASAIGGPLGQVQSGDLSGLADGLVQDVLDPLGAPAQAKCDAEEFQC